VSAPDEMTVELTVNGEPRALSVTVTTNLLTALREVGLTGTKGACEQGECGSCTVLVAGVARCACLIPAEVCAGREVVTVEGVVAPDLAEALARHGAVQCGFCTPGFVVAAVDHLERGGSAEPAAVREALSGNLCRCTGYEALVAAVAEVAQRRQGGR